MKTGFKATAEHVVEKSDVVLIVLDSRFPNESINEFANKLIRRYQKPVIYIINKCDLISVKKAEAIEKQFARDNKKAIFVSVKNRYGSRDLRTELSITLKRMKRTKIFISVIGYPNVGKSSLINLMKGKGVARTSAQSGFTKGKQRVRVSQSFVFFDTPGVLETDDEVILGLINAKNFDKIKEPYDVAFKIFDIAKKDVCEYYGLDADYFETFDDFIVALAEKFNRKIKGNEPDIDYACRKTIQDWQIGHIMLS